jgi:hypothetical protein
VLPLPSVGPGNRFLPIRAVNIATQVVASATSNTVGNYELPNLIPGNYRILVEHQGFKRYERGPFELRVGDVLSVEIALELGALTESITVTVEPPLLESATANLGQVIDGRRLLDLPLPNSNVIYLTQLTPGVISLVPPTYPWAPQQP